MKKLLILLPVFLSVVLFMASCGSSRSFSSRKYMSGNYVTHKHKLQKVNAKEGVDRQAIVGAKDTTTSSGDVATTSNVKASSEDQMIDAKVSKAAVAGSEASSSKTRSEAKVKAKQKVSAFMDTYTFKRFITNKADRKVMAKEDSQGSMDAVALVSFILSIVGVVVNVFAITTIIATAEYVLALLFIVGMVLGIVGLVLGTQGLRRHRKNNGSTLDLIFSIVGTALGGVAILSAFIFAFYTLFFWLAGL